MQWQTYLIDSLAPLVFRSGRPFGSQADINDVSFPMPSSAAGLMRTQYLQQNGGLQGDVVGNDRARLSPEQQQQLQNIHSRGPFLVRIQDHADGTTAALTVLVPKPADALYLAKDKTTEIALERLSPQALDEDSGCDLPAGLLPVQMQSHIKGKPKSGPVFWSLAHSLAWQNGEALTYGQVSEAGSASLPVESRTHVKINRERLSAEEGALFQTAAYDLGHARKNVFDGWSDTHYGFLMQADVAIADDLARFGGEGRLSHFQSTTIPVFTTDDALSQRIQEQKGLRLTLLSPAIFKRGYVPAWLDEDSLEGILPHSQTKVRLKATAIERWLPVSGWDLHQNKPKPMRKAVAAGAVYWFEVLGDVKGIEHTIFNSICDEAQDQRDGFGMVSIAPWSAQ